VADKSKQDDARVQRVMEATKLYLGKSGDELARAYRETESSIRRELASARRDERRRMPCYECEKPICDGWYLDRFTPVAGCCAHRPLAERCLTCVARAEAEGAETPAG
jgi:RNase P subunit RPR2